MRKLFRLTIKRENQLELATRGAIELTIRRQLVVIRDFDLYWSAAWLLRRLLLAAVHIVQPALPVALSLAMAAIFRETFLFDLASLILNSFFSTLRIQHLAQRTFLNREPTVELVLLLYTCLAFLFLGLYLLLRFYFRLFLKFPIAEFLSHNLVIEGHRAAGNVGREAVIHLRGYGRLPSHLLCVVALR